jgi:hypothetical protein
MQWTKFRTRVRDERKIEFCNRCRFWVEVYYPTHEFLEERILFDLKKCLAGIFEGFSKSRNKIFFRKPFEGEKI